LKDVWKVCEWVEKMGVLWVAVSAFVMAVEMGIEVAVWRVE